MIQITIHQAVLTSHDVFTKNEFLSFTNVLNRQNKFYMFFNSFLFISNMWFHDYFIVKKFCQQLIAIEKGPHWKCNMHLTQILTSLIIMVRNCNKLSVQKLVINYWVSFWPWRGFSPLLNWVDDYLNRSELTLAIKVMRVGGNCNRFI